MTDTDTKTETPKTGTPKTETTKTETTPKTTPKTKAKAAIKGKAKSSKVKAKGKAKKAPTKRAGGGRRQKFDVSAKITWIGGENPARDGTERHVRFQRVIKHSGKTVEAFLKAGGIDGTLQRCVTAKLAKVG
jgi:hypothetical protein